MVPRRYSITFPVLMSALQKPFMTAKSDFVLEADREEENSFDRWKEAEFGERCR